MYIEVKNLYFGRCKRLKNGKLIISIVKKIRVNVSFLHTPIVDTVVEYHHKNAKGKLHIKIDTNGNILVTPLDTIYGGYLRGRKFKLIGYDLSAQLDIERRTVKSRLRRRPNRI